MKVRPAGCLIGILWLAVPAPGESAATRPDETPPMRIIPVADAEGLRAAVQASGREAVEVRINRSFSSPQITFPASRFPLSIVGEPGADINFKEISFRGNWSTPPVLNGWAFQQRPRVSLRGVSFTDCDCGGGLIRQHDVERFEVLRCRFARVGTGRFPPDEKGAYCVTSVLVGGERANGRGQPSEWIISDNTFETCAFGSQFASGVDLRGGYATVTGNIFRDCGAIGRVRNLDHLVLVANQILQLRPQWNESTQRLTPSDVLTCTDRRLRMTVTGNVVTGELRHWVTGFVDPELCTIDYNDFAGARFADGNIAHAGGASLDREKWNEAGFDRRSTFSSATTQPGK